MERGSGVTVSEEIREAILCFDEYRRERAVTNPTPRWEAVERAERVLMFHAERYAQKLEEGDAAYCFWLGKEAA